MFKIAEELMHKITEIVNAKESMLACGNMEFANCRCGRNCSYGCGRACSSNCSSAGRLN